DPLEGRHQGRVNEDDLVLGVVDDVGKVFREKTRVQGVQDSARAGRREVELQVPVVVPGERPDTIARAHAYGATMLGSKLVFPDRFLDPVSLIELFREEGVT